MACVVWPGGYIQSIETRAHLDRRAGKGIVWLRNQFDMVENQSTSSFVRLLGMVDTANGVVPRLDPNAGWGFPNLDLQMPFAPFAARRMVRFRSDTTIW